MKEKKFVITEKNVETYVKNISLWIKKNVKSANSNGVVLGLSGGIDSSVVARLCQKADIKVQLVMMPYGNSTNNSKSMEDAKELISKFNFEFHIFDIKQTVDSFYINGENKEEVNLAKANIRPRVRMTYLYQYAQSNNMLVIGTSNLSERTVGYFTKWGDGACDLNPIGMLTKKEVYVLARYLQIPDSIINKQPSAELWEGQTDEQELGISYEQIDNFILSGTSGDENIDSLIKSKSELAKHKLQEIPVFC